MFRRTFLTVLFASFAGVAKAGGVLFDTAPSRNASPNAFGTIAPKAAVRVKVSTQGYPVRGALWTGVGSSRQSAINHLLGGQHAGRFSREWLETLTYTELSSLHSDDHEGQTRWAYVRRPQRAAQPVRQSYWYQPQSNCPGGVCPGTDTYGFFRRRR